MKIENNHFVSIDYALTLDSGELVDKSEPGAPLSFIIGAGQIIPGLEKALEGMEVGQKAQVVIEPEDGYGRTSLDLFQEIPRSMFPADVNIVPGLGFEAEGPHGPMRFRVKSADAEKVLADFNHPLAGERLHFDVTVMDVRPASPEELEGLACDDDACGDEACGGGCGGGDRAVGGCGGGDKAGGGCQGGGC